MASWRAVLARRADGLAVAAMVVGLATTLWTAGSGGGAVAVGYVLAVVLIAASVVGYLSRMNGGRPGGR